MDFRHQELIDSVVQGFYDRAKIDIIIGYHFRHIDDFGQHIPKIQRFWYLILGELPIDLKKKYLELGIPQNIIHAHAYLKIKSGEVGRWVLIFNQILDVHETSENKMLIDRWRLEILKFKKLFLQSKILFN